MSTSWLIEPRRWEVTKTHPYTSKKCPQRAPVVGVSSDPRIQKIKEKYDELQHIKNSRKVQVVSDVVMTTSETHTGISSVCEAITKSGKRCSFKAMCQGKCKKHSK